MLTSLEDYRHVTIIVRSTDNNGNPASNPLPMLWVSRVGTSGVNSVPIDGSGINNWSLLNPDEWGFTYSSTAPNWRFRNKLAKTFENVPNINYLGVGIYNDSSTNTDPSTSQLSLDVIFHN